MDGYQLGLFSEIGYSRRRERESERAARQWSRGSEFELSSFSCSPSGHVGHTIPGKVVINRANAFNLFAVRVHQATDNVDYVDDNSVGDVGTQNSAQVKELCRKGVEKVGGKSWPWLLVSQLVVKQLQLTRAYYHFVNAQ